MISATTAPTNSWKWYLATGFLEDGSLLIDKKSGRFADPDKVKRSITTEILQVARTVYGAALEPRSSVIIQAGASGRGQRSPDAGAKVIFTAARNLASARQGYDAIRNEAAKGRPRPRPDVPVQSDDTGVRCDQVRSRGQDGADRKAAA